MLHIEQFRELVIRPALEAIHLYSEAAEELVLGTALQESGLRYLKQLGGGPALGLWQMEPATHDDIWANYLAYHPDLAGRLKSLAVIPSAMTMVGNLWYAAAMCRVHYYRSPDPLPPAGALLAQAAMWKKVYNTPLGKGSAAEYVENWKRAME